MNVDHTRDISGPLGTVQLVPMPDLDSVTEPKSRAALDTTRGLWLITAPTWHPVWSQYALSVITLDDAPGFPPAVRKFDGATHELLVLAINPEPGPQTVPSMTDHCRRGDMPFLTPVNIAEQFEATDEEMRAVAWLAARAVVHGFLNPETGDAPARVRELWLGSCTKTLAHLRGEVHAS